MLPSAELQRRPMRVLLGICAALIALWCTVAIFVTSNFVLSASAFAGPTEWLNTFRFQLTSAMTWAAFTPIVVAIVERLSFRREHALRSLLILLFLIPILAVTRAVVGAIALELGERRFPRTWLILLSIEIRIHVNIFFILVIAGITKMMDAHRDADENARRALALQTAVAEAEAEQLRAQTQPAFLFGTLSAIRDHVRPDPARADDMIVTLSEFLRHRLDQPAGSTATLLEELELTERYFELRRVRLGEGATLRLEVDEGALNAEVMPFALQMLLETAIGEEKPSAVVLRGRVRGDFLALEAHATPIAANTTLAAVAEERLQQWFGAGCECSVHREHDTGIARVELPLHMSLEGTA